MAQAIPVRLDYLLSMSLWGQAEGRPGTALLPDPQNRDGSDYSTTGNNNLPHLREADPAHGNEELKIDLLRDVCTEVLNDNKDGPPTR